MDLGIEVEIGFGVGLRKLFWTPAIPKHSIFDIRHPTFDMMIHALSNQDLPFAAASAVDIVSLLGTLTPKSLTLQEL